MQSGGSCFLATTDVGRTSGPPAAADGGGEASEASEWDAREQAEREAESREEETLWRRRFRGASLFSFFVVTSLARTGMRGVEEATT